MVEVRFKNNRVSYVRRPGAVTCHVGDVVVIDLQPGHDVGVVSLTGELVKTQMKLRKVKDDHELKRIARKATNDDLTLWHAARTREDETLLESRQIIRRLNIPMKLTDVEFQGDNARATFYYTSEQRVDFRELVRELASTFDIRGLLVRADDATVRKADILQSCFSGFGMKNCKHIGSPEYPQPHL